MNGVFSQIFSFVLSVAILAFAATSAGRAAARKSFRGHVNFCAWCFWLSAIGFIGINLGVFPDAASLSSQLKIQNSLLGVFSFAYASMAAFGLIKNPERRKRKALSRLPVIGGLLVWHLQPMYTIVLFALVDVVLAFVLARNKKTHNYLWRAHIKAALPLPFLAFYSLPAGPWFLAYFLWALVFKNAAVNAALVKDAMLDYDGAIHEQEV